MFAGAQRLHGRAHKHDWRDTHREEGPAWDPGHPSGVVSYPSGVVNLTANVASCVQAR